MSIEAGGTFKCNDDVLTGDIEHLWVIISDPTLHPDCVVIVNLTSRKYKNDDPACDLIVGDHPFIIKPTFVKYRETMVVTKRQLEEASISHKTSVDMRVLQRIRAGAGKSRFIPRFIKKHLIDQGIIESE